MIEIIKVIPAENFAGTKRCCVIVKDLAVDKFTAMTDKFLTEYQKRRFRRIFQQAHLHTRLRWSGHDRVREDDGRLRPRHA